MSVTPSSSEATRPEPDIGQEADPEPARRRRVTIGGALVVVVAVSMVVLWAYALFGRPVVPGKLEGSPFPATAQQVCTEARADLDRIPRSISVRNPAERAVLVDRGTDTLQEMVDRLAAAAPTTEPAKTVVTEWLSDWRTYLDNRRDYANRLRGDPNARFYVRQSDRDNSQITSALDRLAKVNQMEACTVPDDVG